MTYEVINREMIQALDDEISAIKQDGGSQQVALQAGLRKGRAAGKILYSFLLAFELAVLDDTPALLKVGTQSYDVIVVSIEGFEVTLAVSMDIGERVPQAALALAPYFLLELLKKRLQEIERGELAADKMMALRLFNLAPNLQLQAPGPLVRPSTAKNPPNSEQQRAVDKALCQAISFIWGPPGTGKTTSIQHLVPRLVQADERVFITSHTNVAVDSVLKAAAKGFAADELERGAVVRVGQPKDGQDQEIAYVTLDAIVERRSRSLQQQLAHLATSLSREKQALQFWQSWQQELEQVNRLQKQVSRARTEEGDASALVRKAEANLANEKHNGVVLEQRLREAQEAGWFIRLVRGLNPEQIRADLSAKLQQIATLELNLVAARKAKTTATEAITLAVRELETAQRRLSDKGNVPTSEQVTAGIRKTAAELSRLEKAIADVKAELAAVAAAVIKEARVVGATLSKLTTTSELHRSAFDALIIDEASMIPQPHLWFAGSLAKKRAVILGDFRQLPPIATAESDVAIRRLSTDIFSQAGIVDKHQRVQHRDTRLTSLRRQYRMHKAIGELANLLVYRQDENPLDHAATTDSYATGLGAQPAKGFPLVLCDTSAVDPWCARLEPKFSRYNVYTALLAVRLAHEAIRGDGTVTVGVISPYAAQARLIQTLAKQHTELAPQVQIATVHRFQGSEKDVMIVDLVDGPPLPIGTLLQDDKAKRLLNVAFTRARGKLILICNCGHFARKRSGEVLNQTLDYFGQHAQALDSRTVLANYADEAVLKLDQQLRAGQGLGNPEGISWYHEGNFYDALTRDFESAQQQVIILSPFMRPTRTTKLATVIRHLIDRGVPVHIVTRAESSPEESEKAQLIQDLQRMGVKVTSRKGLHEKLAFVDNRIVWFGSLNILSQSNSTEQMMRFQNEDVTIRLLEFSGVASLLQQEKRREQRTQLLDRLLASLLPRMSVPACPSCGRTMVLRTGGKGGPFFGCQGYPHCDQTVNIPRPTLQAAVEDLNIPCPGCQQGRMRLKWSAKGPFLGCDRYPEDKTTLPLG